jgi:hypothetical protein
MTKENSKREGWTAEDLGEQSAYEGTTEFKRRLLRGDETVGDADARDVAGAVLHEESTGPIEGPLEPSEQRKQPATSSASTVDRGLELHELLRLYAPGEPHDAEAVTNDFTSFVHLAPQALLQKSIAAVLWRSERRQELGTFVGRLAESYMEHDRDEAFSHVLDASPGPPPAGVHQAMTPAELRILVPRIASQNPATIDRLAELIASDAGRARALGPDVLAEILSAAASRHER